jgi:DNA-binding MarR family transcriptional regulator
MPDVTPLGESYRGTEGRLGFLLVQAHRSLRNAMDAALRPSGLTSAQFGTLSVIVREPGLSAADLARVVPVTPQAMNLLVTALERDGLVERRPHPTHGRILEIHPTDAGIRKLEATYPIVIDLEDRIAAGLSERQLATIKRWLVNAAIAVTDAR